jgi:hypothetical protein
MPCPALPCPALPCPSWALGLLGSWALGLLGSWALGRLGCPEETKFFDPLLIFKGFLKTTYSRTSPAHYFFRGK